MATVGGQVAKGRISIPETGEVLVFMFNPNMVKDQKGVAYPDQVVPGMSHPVTQFAGGGARVISFEIYLDGDRGRMGQSTSNGQLQNHSRAPRVGDKNPRVSQGPQPNAPDKDITAEIDFYRSLLYPIAVNGGGLADVHPPILVFSMGTLFQSIICVAERCDVQVTSFNVKLRPVRATLNVSLKEVVESSVTRSTVFNTANTGSVGQRYVPR